MTAPRAARGSAGLLALVLGCGIAVAAQGPAPTPADVVCAEYASRVTELASAPGLLPEKAKAILQANALEQKVCDLPAIDEASRLIVARVGLRMLELASQIQAIPPKEPTE